MNVLEMTNVTKFPGRSAKAFLNGEDVTNDVYKVEINCTDILLYRIKRPSEPTPDGKDLVRYVTEIDELKVNG